MTATGLLLFVWLAANGCVFLLYGLDKRLAIRGEWRVPERALLAGMWLLGGPGALLGMRIFHHKTKKPAFRRCAVPACAMSLALLALAAARCANIL